MKTVKNPPLSGYALLDVYTYEQSLKPYDGNKKPPIETEVSFGWDWRYVTTDIFEVKLLVSITPTVDKPLSASSTLVGTFRVSGTPRIPLESFVTLQAVAILLPYARQYLANLTVNTLGGAFHLPSINVEELMTRFDLTKATATSQKENGDIPKTLSESLKRLKAAHKGRLKQG